MELRQTTLTPPATDDFWRSWLHERDFFVRMCRRWLPGQPYEIEDVLSDGALKALRYVQRNPGVVQRFRPWALRILYNLCVDRMRARSRGLQLYNDEEDQVCESPRGCPARADQQVFRLELGAAIDRAIATLPSRLRTTFELRFIESLPYAEISAMLEISPDNARKRIQQARSHLRRQLGDYCVWSAA